MKKIIIAIALIASCLALSACGAEQKMPEPDQSPTTSASDPTEEENVSEPENGIEKIALSGNADDVFTAENDCYTEGEKVVLYFGKGVNVKGDMLAMTEQVMDELTAITGRDFSSDGAVDDYTEFRHLGLENSSFEHVNPGAEKINVVLAYNPEMQGLQCAFESGALLDEYDYDLEMTGYQTLYHELSHVIHLRKSANLGRTLCEGYAVYLSYNAMMAKELPVWSHIQYLFPVSFDESCVYNGADGFRCDFDIREDNYNYGFRLVMFLEETYGKDTFFRIADEAEARRFDASYDTDDIEGSKAADTEELKEIIISQTSEDVFERFADWYKNQWGKKGDDFKAYMESIGQPVPGT